jgi:hypothetical protein
MLEEKLEKLYCYALVPNCPLGSKTRSVSKLAIKALENLPAPTKLTQIKFFSQKLFEYCSNRNKDISQQDCMDYLSWKVWQYKIEDIDSRIINQGCRAIAKFMGSNILLELHKVASRLQREGKKLHQLDKEDPQIKPAIESMVEAFNTSTKVINTMLVTHLEQFEDIKQLVEAEEIKQLGGNQDA